MKKLILTAAALFIFSGLYAQEKEIDAALSAYESNNVAVAKVELAKVNAQIESNTISPEAKAKYYYTAGQIALKEGKSIEAAKFFGYLNQNEIGTVYSIKNKSTKSTEYFATKAEAEKVAATGEYSKVKEETLTPKYLPQIQDQLRGLAENVLKQATTAASANNDVVAGDKFLEASYLVKAIGGDADLFKYNAALSYHKGKSYDKALAIYKELIAEDYTGVNTTWTATEKESGKEVNFNSKNEAEMQQKLGLISNLKESKTPSVEKNLYSYTLDVLSSLKKYDDVVEKINSKYPNDSQIQTLLGNVYHFSGKEDMFLNKLLESIKLNPKDASNYFNAGVLYMNQNNDAKALEFFENAIKVDPTYKNAYTNIALIKVKPEKEYVEIINKNLGNNDKERKVYKEYTAKRKAIYVEAIPYLEKAFELDKTSYEHAKMLRQAYQAAEMFDKEDAMRKVEKSLQK